MCGVVWCVYVWCGGACIRCGGVCVCGVVCGVVVCVRCGGVCGVWYGVWCVCEWCGVVFVEGGGGAAVTSHSLAFCSGS